VLFKIEVEFAAEKWHIFRKYKQYQEIDAVFRRGIPGFPGVLPMSGKKFDKDFLEERKRALDLYLKVLCEGRPHVFQKKLCALTFLRFIAPAQLGDYKPTGFVQPFKIELYM